MIDWMIANVDWVITVIGVWMAADGIYSINVYLNTPAMWREDVGNVKQTWRRDHWIRACRILGGLVLMILGALL
jgi:hypothetical protein